MLMNEEDCGSITIVQLATHRLSAAALPALLASRDKLLARGQHGMLIDLGRVRRITTAGIAALVELAAQFKPGCPLAFCNAAPTVATQLAASHIATLLPHFPTRDCALQSPPFLARRLTGTKALILCAGAGSRMAPLSAACPKPLLPLFGTPILTYILDHLGQFGIDDVLLNPGYHGDQFLKFRPTQPQQRLHFFNEGRQDADGWHAEPIGSASTLARLHHRHNMLTSDLIVLCGDALVDINLADMMRHHRNTGATATIATAKVPRASCQKYGILQTDSTGRVLSFQEKPTPAQALSNLANTGVYIFSPTVAPYLIDAPDQDIATHLLPSLLKNGRLISAYEEPFEWVDLGCPHDYAQAHFDAVNAQLRTLAPAGLKMREDLWCGKGAHLSRRTKITGPCYIGRNATIEKGVEINGPCIIGDNCRISGPSLIHNSIILADTQVHPGAWIDGQITAPTWSIGHADADGTLARHPHPALDRVGPIELSPTHVSQNKGIRA